jgi:hypothetical protein
MRVAGNSFLEFPATVDCLVTIPLNAGKAKRLSSDLGQVRRYVSEGGFF